MAILNTQIWPFNAAALHILPSIPSAQVELHSQLVHGLAISSTLCLVFPAGKTHLRDATELAANLCTLKTIVWSLGNPSRSFTIL